MSQGIPPMIPLNSHIQTNPPFYSPISITGHRPPPTIAAVLAVLAVLDLEACPKQCINVRWNISKFVLHGLSTGVARQYRGSYRGAILMYVVSSQVRDKVALTFIHVPSPTQTLN